MNKNKFMRHNGYKSVDYVTRVEYVNARCIKVEVEALDQDPSFPFIKEIVTNHLHVESAINRAQERLHITIDEIQTSPNVLMANLGFKPIPTDTIIQDPLAEMLLSKEDEMRCEKELLKKSDGPCW